MTSTNSMGKGKSVREVLVNFAELCSMQGIPYVHAATFWWSRLIWVVLTLSAIGALIFHMYYIMSQYYEYPVQTKASFGFDNLQLPAITICNINVVRKSKLYEINSTEMELLREIVRSMGTIPLEDDHSERRKRSVEGNSENNISNFFDFGFLKQLVFFLQNIFKYTYMDLPREVRKDAGHFMSDMVVSCSFAGRECTAKDFILHQTDDYGNCWELNTTDMITKRSGDMGGLTLTLNLQNWENLEGISQGYGARLVVHEPGTIPFPSSEGIFISPSFETNIGLRMVTVSRLGEPYAQCDDGKTFQERYGVTYTRQSCQFICLMSTVVRICGCYDDSEEELVTMVHGTTRRCRTETDFVCYSKVIQDYRDHEISCDCLNPCNENGYVKTMSSRLWPTEKYAKHLLYTICNETVDACASLTDGYTENSPLSYNFLKLNVYFEDLNYESIYETPEIALSQFMSDVGGAIGLWIGLSVLAVCEIFHLIIELCALGIHKCCSIGQTQHNSEGHIEHSREEKIINKENIHHEKPGQKRKHFQIVPSDSFNHNQYQHHLGYLSSSQNYSYFRS